MIWPELGREVLHAIWTVILDDGAHPILRDGTVISTTMNNDGMIVQLEGTVYAVAEVVEVLSWLSAALRTPKENIATCLPVTSDISSEGQPFLSFKISYSVQGLETKGNGHCWHKMFRSSMIVLGYPIRRRVAMLGLEISLSVITKLLYSNRMNVFNGKLILKGFSAMLLPTDQNGISYSGITYTRRKEITWAAQRLTHLTERASMSVICRKGMSLDGALMLKSLQVSILSLQL